VQNRYGENVTINIQGGRPGMEIQGSFLSERGREKGIFARRLPVVGEREWLLIYEDTLLELSVKDAYDEIEIVLV
jgi:hypothetical protein